MNTIDDVNKTTFKEVIQKVKKVIRVIKVVILVCTVIMMVLTNPYRTQLLDKLDSRTIPEITPYVKYVHYIPSPLLGNIGFITMGNDFINSSEDISKLLTVISYDEGKSEVSKDRIEELREELRKANDNRIKHIQTEDSFVNKLYAFDNSIYNLINEMIDINKEDLDKSNLENLSDKILAESEKTIDLLYKVVTVEFIMITISIDTFGGLIFRFIIYIRKLNKENKDGELV